MKQRKEICAYCGLDREATRDHVPPKLFFARPFPTNMPTVPACAECNASFKADDEYTRIVLASDPRVGAHRDVLGSILSISRGLARPQSQAFTKMLSENVAWTGVLGPSGAPIATREIARHRIDATGRHIVRGLHYFEFGRPVDPDAAVLLGFLSANWTPSHPMILEFAKMYFHSEQRQKDVGKALSYAVGRWEDKSCWMLLLYGTFMWLGTIGPPPNDDVIISDPARIPDPI